MIKRIEKLLSVAALAATVALPYGAAAEMNNAQALKLDTTGGFKLSTADQAFNFQLGGRFMWDVDYFDGAFNGDNGGDGALHENLRRARIEMKGVVYTDWKWKLTYDLVGGGAIAQAALGYAGNKGHYFQIGQDKEPIGLEELTSSKWITATERSMFWDSTQADNFNFGLLYQGYRGPFTWAAGVFDGGLDDDADDVFATTARVTFAPLAQAGKVLHFGLAFSDRNPQGGSSEESDLINASPGISDQSNGNSDNVFEVGISGVVDKEVIQAAEFLWIGGPASVQAEYFQRDIGLETGPDMETTAYYLTAAYTLTGESRGYKAKAAIADKISPMKAGGAWEIFARLDHIASDCGSGAGCNADFNPGGGAPALIALGSEPEVTAITLGVNWYANKAIKFALNYTHTDSNDFVPTAAGAAANVDDDGSALTFRTQLVF